MTFRVRVGKALDLCGRLFLPLGVGVVAGYWASDQGVVWLPTMASILCATAVLALLGIAGGKWLQGTAFVDTPDGVKVRKRVGLLLVLVVIATLIQLGVFMMQESSPLTDLSGDGFEDAYRVDSASYYAVDKEMTQLLVRLEGESFLQGKGVLSPAAEATLLDAWIAMQHYTLVLEGIRIFYEDWYRFDPSRVQRSYHTRSFLLAYGSELTTYSHTSWFSSLVLRNPDAKKFLDTPHATLGIPANTFSRFREEMHGTRDQSRVASGKQYLDFIDRAFNAQDDIGADGIALWRHVAGQWDRLDDRAPIQTAKLNIRSDAQGLKRGLRRVWFPAQKEVAEWMGDARVRRIGWYLVTEDQQAAMDNALEPGDIMLSRKNWYLSNVGLPGFWPHAMLYIGSPEKLAAYFDSDADVDAWVKENEGSGHFSDHLKTKWPEQWKRYVNGNGTVIIEAVSEGVLFNSLAKASGDYVSAMRPRLDKRDKAHAVAEAFAHLGKPYDFDFDFATDHAIVCSELVWRSYRPGPANKGVTIPLVTVAGRRTLPSNEWARLFDEQRGTDAQQLDFVYFVDAHEKKREAFVSDEDAFASSHTRVQWDVMLQ